MSEVKTALKPAQWPVENIYAYENNAKIHDQAQIEAIAKSIKRFGWDQPIVIDGAGVIIKGHGRWLAAKHLGMKFVPVIVRTDLTAAEANASRLADNRVARTGDDTNKLQAELVSLAEIGEIDLTDMGFTEKELAFMTGDLGAMNEDALMIEGGDAGSVAETERDIEQIDKQETSIIRLLGFSMVPNEQGRDVVTWMTAIEGLTGKRGLEAFVEHIRSQIPELESQLELTE